MFLLWARIYLSSFFFFFLNGIECLGPRGLCPKDHPRHICSFIIIFTRKKSYSNEVSVTYLCIGVCFRKDFSEVTKYIYFSDTKWSFSCLSVEIKKKWSNLHASAYCFYLLSTGLDTAEKSKKSNNAGLWMIHGSLFSGSSNPMPFTNRKLSQWWHGLQGLSFHYF